MLWEPNNKNCSHIVPDCHRLALRSYPILQELLGALDSYSMVQMIHPGPGEGVGLDLK